MHIPLCPVRSTHWSYSCSSSGQSVGRQAPLSTIAPRARCCSVLSPGLYSDCESIGTFVEVMAADMDLVMINRMTECMQPQTVEDVVCWPKFQNNAHFEKQVH
ncbi:uncharacterized protein LOC124667891 isoform X1 [Lolium rigidum]|uniref:uncharacterized protein LOC124667891 isoform X1 n=1 Tax=Lolium rigidum TaxID=89674 RepID=UPI001F5D1C35|nr:uncharacterized protein LOC124667891 isoform X1 [Lolium rigidum]